MRKKTIFTILGILVFPLTIFTLVGGGTSTTEAMDTVNPEVTVNYPNSGEELYVGDAADIIRSAKDDELTRLNSPENLTITIIVNDVYLSWDVVQDALFYNIYRSNTANSGFTLIGTSGTTNYTGLNACLQEKYFYYVSAEDGYQTVADIDGNVYQTVQIGDQVWMAENLKVTHYNNGDAILHLPDNGDWISTNSGAYCVYSNIPDYADTYGNLYNGYAINDTRNIAPVGWHVPTDVEIMELEMVLGMSVTQADSIGFRGTNEGSKLAGRADLWIDGALENDPEFNTSGFSFLPGGYRYHGNGTYFWIGNMSGFWSTTVEGIDRNWGRFFENDDSRIQRSSFDYNFGAYIRCVRD